MSALSGMTGFARATSSGDFGTLSAEARSVNGRGLDIRLRLPDGMAHLEAEVRGRIKAAFERGSISITISLEKAEAAEGAVHIDEARLRTLALAGRELVDKGLAMPPRIDGLLALRGVIVSEDNARGGDADIQAMEAAVLPLVDDLIAALQSARHDEGAQLKSVLELQIHEIDALKAQAASHPAATADAIRERLKQKIDDLLPSGIDPDRLAQEAAILAVKADVREEIDRLTGHVEAARALLSGGSPCGRKLDFLAQEFNREVNTLCSKSSDRGLTEIGLAMKHVVDQFREQVQNLE